MTANNPVDNTSYPYMEDSFYDVLNFFWNKINTDKRCLNCWVQSYARRNNFHTWAAIRKQGN